jgi:VWFA-related protein
VLNRQLDAGRRAHDWVTKLAGGDLVAIASYDTSLVIEQDFTADRALLQKAIDRAVRGSEPTGNWPSRLPPEGGPSLLRHLPKGEALRDRTTRIQGAFEVLAEAARPIVGRKNVIFFSTGYGRVNNFGQYQPDPVYDPPAQRALNDANIAVYTIDLLQSQAFSPLQDSMSDLSDVTGGRFFHNIVNFVTPLQQIAEETSGYYMLAYQATHPHGTSGYQAVKVTVSNPEFRVKAREGYLYGQ